MGPCLNSFVLTWHDGKTTVDVFYRTTEYGKKFPADLIFIRDTLLPEFDLTSAPLEAINFHFCNITVTPMYSLIPMICLNPDMELDKYIEYIDNNHPGFRNEKLKKGLMTNG